MNFTQAQMSELLLELANGKDGIATLMRMTLETIMKKEQELYLSSNDDYANGYRPVMASGTGYEMVLQVPRTRKGAFYPVLLGIIRKEEEERNKLVSVLYTKGLTTEDISEVWEKLYGKTYTKGQISNLMRETKKEVNLWLERRLDKHYLVLYIDATFVHTRRDESVSKEAYYSILGVKTDGTREVLAVVNHPTEGATNWENELNNLKTRGLETTNLVVSDALTGIENAVAKAFPGADHQFCLVHLKRQLLSCFPLKSKEEIAKELKIVFPVGQEEITPCEAFLKYKAFIEKHEVKYKSLSSCKSDRYIHYFTYLNYPKEIQQMIYSTNWIERLNRDHKRVLKMRASLPNPEAVIFLMGSVAQERTETTYSYPIAAFKMPELKKIDRKVVEKKDLKKE